MKFTPARLAAYLLLLGAFTPAAIGQDLVGQLKNDVRNTFSQQPAADYPPAADTTNTLERPTGAQFRATTAVGGWMGHRITNTSGTLLAGPQTNVEGPTTLQLPADANGLKLQGVSFGRGLMGRTPDAYFGDVLLPPNIDDQGNTVDGLNAFYAQPVNSGDFYFSQASNQVFASQAGVVLVEWKLKSNDAIVPVQYVVAASTNPAERPARIIYWTKNGYYGIPINVPASARLNITYNREVPERVPTEFQPRYVQDNRDASQFVYQTLWFSPSNSGQSQEIGGQLHAYNREGLVLIEILDSDNRFLGTEVVQIRRETIPIISKADIGSRLFSFPKNEALRPQVIAGQTGQNRFVDVHAVPSKNEIHVYAVRTTSPFPNDSFGNPRPSGEVQIFWLEKSVADIEWPMIHNSYIIEWPLTTALDAYTTFVRQLGDDGDNQATAVQLDPFNNPTLLFQDDPFGTQTKIESGTQLSTYLADGDRDGLSLIRHQVGEEVWYERIYSVLAVDQPSYGAPVEAVVGQRLTPPDIFPLLGVITTSGSRTVTLPSTTGLVIGMGVSGPGIPVGATIAAVPNSIAITISADATATTLIGATYANDSTAVTLASPTALTIGTAVSGPGIPAGATIADIPSPVTLTLSVATTDAASNVAGVTASIAQSLGTTVGYVRLRPKAGLSGDALKRWQYRSAYDATAFIDPFTAGFETAKAGAIIPVNARAETTDTASYQDELEVWWYKASQPPAGSVSLKPNYYPVRTMLYKLVWPADAEKIILASNKGSGPLVAPQSTGRVYYQNDAGSIGFNPNDEHALLLGGSVWAIRDDLGTATTSRPFVLLRYTAADARPAMRVFQVQREDLDLATPVQFVYSVEAGKVLQAPMPLPLLQIPTWPSSTAPKNFEEAATATPNPDNTGSSKPAHYAGYTIEDRKGNTWCYRGPHSNEDPATAEFSMNFFYPFQTGFFIPGVTNQPAVGTTMPYLRKAPTDGNYEAHAVAESNVSDKESLGIRYLPTWPRFAPVLRMGETHTLPRYGLPAVRGQTSVSVIYEQKLAEEDGGSSVTLFDPTVAKTSSMEDAGLLDAGNMKIPAGVRAELYQGKYYFPNLPPHLAERFFINPNVGSKGSAVLIGKFFDEVLGSDYLHLNVLTTKDVAYLKGLCPDGDEDQDAWNDLIDGLSVNATRYVENTKKPGTFIPATDATVEARITAVWNYINGTNWSTKLMPPTAAELATATGQASGDLQTAVDWIRSNFVDLATHSRKFYGSTAASNEGGSLKSAFASYMGITQGDLSAFLRVDNRTVSGVNYTHFRTHNSTTAPQLRGVSLITQGQAKYLTRKAQIEKLSEWIFAQDPVAPDGSSPSVRQWSGAGTSILRTTLRAEDIKTKLIVGSSTSDATLDYFKFDEEATETEIPSDLREKAFNFVDAYRARLVAWDTAVSTPTPGAADLAAFQSDYEAAERTSATAIDGTHIVEATHPDIAVDSYALTADGGEGWVTLLMGNGKAFTPKAEPISMYVIQVRKPLGAGEIKVVASSNPLSESLTLQSSLDFAGKPEQYEFEWKTRPPEDGLPPPVYSFQRVLAMGDGVWQMKNKDGATSAVNLPSNVQLVGNPAGSTPVISPLVSGERTVNLTSLPYRAFISIQLDAATDYMQVSINGTPVVLKNYPDSTDSTTTSKPLASFVPLPLLYEVPVSTLKAGDNLIELALGTTAAAGTAR